MTPEFSRPVRIDTLGPAPRDMPIEAEPSEREALAARFDLASVESLRADLILSRRGELVFAKGKLAAAVTQTCVLTDESVPSHIEERFEIVFRPSPEENADEEIELSQSEMDVVFYDGTSIDVGEAVAETLSLSLDPYPRAPGAEDVLRQAGVRLEENAKAEREAESAANSPFAILRKTRP